MGRVKGGGWASSLLLMRCTGEGSIDDGVEVTEQQTIKVDRVAAVMERDVAGGFDVANEPSVGILGMR